MTVQISSVCGLTPIREWWTTPTTLRVAQKATAMDDDDQVIFYPNQGVDPHNRCCGGSMWCIQVKIIWLIFLYSRSYYLFFQDICGIICAIFTWLLILYAEFVVTFVTLLPCPYPIFQCVNMVIFQIFAFLAMASHLRTMFTDPVCSHNLTILLIYYNINIA